MPPFREGSSVRPYPWVVPTPPRWRLALWGGLEKLPGTMADRPRRFWKSRVALSNMVAVGHTVATEHLKWELKCAVGTQSATGFADSVPLRAAVECHTSSPSWVELDWLLTGLMTNPSPVM